MTTAALLALSLLAPAQDVLPRVTDAELQPLKVHVKRLREAIGHLGMALPKEAADKLDRAASEQDGGRALKLIQDALDPLCLIGVSINPESRVKVMTGPAPSVLIEQGWRQFLVKVKNEAGVTAQLKASRMASQALM